MWCASHVISQKEITCNRTLAIFRPALLELYINLLFYIALYSVAECARWVPSLVSEQQVLYILLVFPVELRSLDKYNDHQKAMSPICIPDIS